MTVILDVNFDGAETEIGSGYDDGINAIRSSGNTPTISTEQFNSSTKSMKVFLDYDVSATNYRTEMQAEGFADFVKTWTYSFDIYLPAEYISNDADWETVMQFHALADSGLGELSRSPPFSIGTTDGRWTIARRWDTRPVNVPGDFEGFIQYDLGSNIADLGKWVNWEVEIFYSWLSDGRCTIKKDGRIIFYMEGPNCYNDAVAPYFKSGIYSGWGNTAPLAGQPRTRTLYFDNYKIEST